MPVPADTVQANVGWVTSGVPNWSDATAVNASVAPVATVAVAAVTTTAVTV